MDKPVLPASSFSEPYIGFFPPSPALPRLSGNEVTFIVRRFNKIEGLPYHLKEIKPIVSDMPTANLYQTVEIPMDSTAGDLELFVWGNLNTLQPLCGVITVE